MQIIPVIDLLGGTVVRGVRGRREEYRPIRSRLVESSEPFTVATAFREQLGLNRLYLADLDAIVHQRPNREVYRALAAEDFRLLIDAGLRDPEAAEVVFTDGAAQVVAGLETWPGPAALARLCERFGRERVVFSLDLKEGNPLGESAAWETRDPFGIAVRVIESGIGELIVLDLAQVGSRAGVGTEGLCRRIIERFPDVRIVAGGGVRGLSDLERLSTIGVQGALVASALHDGLIGRGEIEKLTAG